MIGGTQELTAAAIPSAGLALLRVSRTRVQGGFLINIGFIRGTNMPLIEA